MLEINKSQRHIRGGLATKKKYFLEKQQAAFLANQKKQRDVASNPSR